MKQGRKQDLISPRQLENIRILDLTNVLAGPFCCHQLAHLGAEIIKIEPVGTGDPARQLGADPQLSDKDMGISFLAQNAGKKSVTLNLKTPTGVAIFKKLVRTADVLVENFRPGVMTKLTLDYPVLQADNPQLIYCAISGFGQDGSLAKRPAYDQIIQGWSGVMSITGAPKSEPLRVGYPIADTIGGLTAALAITAALNAKPRGCFIDVSMLEATLATMGWAVSNFLIGGVKPSQQGNENVTSAPSGTFQVKNGLLNIAVNKDEQWQQLIAQLDRPELLTDARFATQKLRMQNRHALKAELEITLATKTVATWERQLNQVGVPAGAVLSVPETLAHPQIRERGMIAKYKQVPGIDRDIELLRPGFKINGQPPQADGPPPRLGEQNNEILAELGYDVAEIKQLQDKGII